MKIHSNNPRRWTHAMRPQNRSGFSLLEVILSIAILGGALAVIGQLVNIGYRSANETRIRSDANILVDTKMAEVAAGVLELESTSGRCEENPEWNYEIEVEQSGILGLMRVKATVTQSQAVTTDPISISIQRFMPDPDYDPLDYIEEE